MPCGYIRDGYTRDGYLVATPFYDALSFKYRPMLPVDRAGVLRRIAEADQAKGQDGKTDKGAMEAEKILIAETAARLVSWDLADDEGNPVPVSPADLGRVDAHILSRLFNTISGYEAGDVKPSDQAEEAAAKN